MSQFSDLVKGFRANVKNGIPTTLYFSGKDIILSIHKPNPNGHMGMCRITIKPVKG